MRWAALLAGVLLGLASPGQADPIRLRSGDHGSFTRLVASLETPQSWTLEGSGGSHVLRLASGAGEFDTSEVFGRIGRNRLVAIAPLPGGFRVTLNPDCTCRVEAFEFKPGIVVLDIRDGQPQPVVPPPDIAVPPPQIGAAGQLVLPLLLPKPPPRRAQFAIPQAMTTHAEVRSALLGAVSRAATEGNVIVALPAIGPSAMAAAGGSARQTTALQHVQPETASAATGCDQASALDAQTLGIAGMRPAAALALARNRGLDADGRADARALVWGAGIYLHYGFGAEALRLLDQIATPGAETRFLRLVAQLVEGHAAPLLAGQGQFLSCDTAMALWSLLALPERAPAQGINGRAVARSFAELPPSLRQILGHRVQRRLAAAGQVAAGAMVESATRRVSAPIVHPSRSAALAVDPVELAEAVIGRVEAGEVIPLAELEKLDALARIHRKAPAGARLRAAVALSHGSRDDFDAAFAAAGDGGDVAPRLFDLLAGAGGDDALLHFALNPPPSVTISQTAAKKIAARLLDLGFAEQARGWTVAAAKPPVVGHALNPDDRQRTDPARASALPAGPPTSALPEGGVVAGGAAPVPVSAPVSIAGLTRLLESSVTMRGQLGAGLLAD